MKIRAEILRQKLASIEKTAQYGDYEDSGFLPRNVRNYADLFVGAMPALLHGSMPGNTPVGSVTGRTALMSPTGMGAILGAVGAPEGDKVRGAIHGATQLTTTAAGGIAGGALGDLGGAAAAAGVVALVRKMNWGLRGIDAREDTERVGRVLGTILGIGGGLYAGHKAGGALGTALTGYTPPDKKRKNKGK